MNFEKDEQYKTRENVIRAFSSLAFHPQREPLFDEPEPDSVASSVCGIDGKQFDLQASKKSNSQKEVLRYYLCNDVGIAYKGYILLTQTQGGVEAELDVGIVQRENETLKKKGIGMALMDASLQYLQQQVPILQKNIRVVIDYSEDYPFPNQGLPFEQWVKIISPLLERYGFAQSGEDREWTRTFYYQGDT